MKKKTIIITLCLIAAVVTGAACMLYVHSAVKSDEEVVTLLSKLKADEMFPLYAIHSECDSVFVIKPYATDFAERHAHIMMSDKLKNQIINVAIGNEEYCQLLFVRNNEVVSYAKVERAVADFAHLESDAYGAEDKLFLDQNRDVKENKPEAPISAERQAAIDFKNKNAGRLRSYLGTGNYVHAKQLLDSILVNYPNDPQSNFAYGYIAEMEGDDSSAKRYYQKSISIYDSIIVSKLDIWNDMNRAYTILYMSGRKAYLATLDSVSELRKYSSDRRNWEVIENMRQLGLSMKHKGVSFGAEEGKPFD
ncbi:MAG: hypothetical protein K6D91_02775 [Prevotella sp.]|nr:hypothetical protein [Prevotella sp.]